MLEALETRVVPYAVSGNAWPSPQLITLSFEPDGTVVAGGSGGNITSTMFATFNGKWGASNQVNWENIVVKAAQTWAASANVNFTVVGDDGSAYNAPLFQQGAPDVGDIRVGAYNFGYNWIGSTEYPPPANNWSGAGDVGFNTQYNFNIGTTYDLFTVAAHEIGHALGLGLSSSYYAVMYSPYTGARTALYGDDVSGIQAIYGPRPPNAPNNSFSTASDISSTITPVLLTSVVSGLNISTTSAANYFKFTAPAGSSSTMTVTVQSTGLSLFTPKVTVYAADQQTVLGSASFVLPTNAPEDGATLNVPVSGVTPGTTYYVKVTGVDSSVFSTGAYALTLNLGILPNPTVPLPITQLLDGTPIHSGGGQPIVADSPPPALPATTTTSAASDAKAVSAFAVHSTAAPVVVSVPMTSATTPAATSPATSQSVAPAVGRVEGGSLGRTSGEPEGSDQPFVAPAKEGDGQPDAAPVAPAVLQPSVPPVAAPAETTEAFFRSVVEPEVRTESSSADAVAEAAADDWTRDGALAAASVLFAGTWLRRDAAHSRDEERPHYRPARRRPSAR